MRKIGLVTVGRSDYGIYKSVINEIKENDSLNLEVYATGMHLSKAHGYSYSKIKKDNYDKVVKIKSFKGDSTPELISKSIAKGIKNFSTYFSKNKPDILLVLGDRYEMLAATIASIPFNIPIAHIHGGEITIGAFDDSIRHSITKFSHIHFTSTEEYRSRIIQLGENPDLVFNSGAPALVHIKNMKLLSRDELWNKYKFSFKEAPLLVTYHPETKAYQEEISNFKNLLNVLKTTNLPVVFTLANADTGGSKINELIRNSVANTNNWSVVNNFGQINYFSMLKYAKAMIGNSSSGIIEASSFKLPVVNIGDRQAGRIRTKNVIDSKNSNKAISEAINKATSDAFNNELKGIINPHFNLDSAKIISSKLAKIELNGITYKKFFDLKK